ncbi:unnamed protein product, partial [Polarella glacialis]
QSMGIRPDVITFSAAITAASRSERWQAALGFMEDMQRQELMPNHITFNAAMDACSRGGRWEVALTLLRRMAHDGLKPDLVAASLAVSACASAGQQASTVELLLRMESDGLRPDQSAFVGMIGACKDGHLWEISLSLLGDMVAAGFGAESASEQAAFSTAIGACEAQGEWAHALAVLARMQQDGPEPNLVTYNAAALALLSVGRLPDALALYREAVNCGDLQPSWSASTEDNSRPPGSRAFPAARLDLHRFPVELAKLAVLAELVDE